MDGIYCLANDAVADWWIAFIHSLRSRPANRDIPVSVIPYDDRTERVRALAARYAYEVLEDPHLERVERLGPRVGPSDAVRMPALRKLAAFWGPYERFLFLDSDIVVTADLPPLIERAHGAGVDLVYFDHDVSQVYSGPLAAELPFDLGTVPGFNTGAFVSRRGVLDPGAVDELACLAQGHRGAFVAPVAEQPFLNFAFDASGRTTAAYAEIDTGVATAMWAGLRLAETDGVWTVDDPSRADHGRRLPFVHWAGSTLTPWMPYKDLWAQHRLAGERVAGGRLRLEARLARMAAGRGRIAASRAIGQAMPRRRRTSRSRA